MENIQYIEGSLELLQEVKPLWQKLNIHHINNSVHYADRFRSMTFEKRNNKFKDVKNIYINLVKDTALNTYIGYCISTISDDLNGEVDSLYVDEDYRKYGVGHQLMVNSIDWLNKHKVKSKTIGVATGNEAVIDFYKHYNFYPSKIILEEVNK
ncbi:GNAT family N-acetyltransferase [Alkaliphilus pronyensis]|uniref:GNAT family N-acetyltransferase n=1 Tax=Alkaliphilus pronyensis TaxID=1482732 RepID=A0A6I0F685_9FIRM|nr:GNAT family N-acetyltransferase [Alkaliphilus pronyensis]KAB3530681.1 GNAT family N-acetyltransferase [Alkaliphilus pronyensis]